MLKLVVVSKNHKPRRIARICGTTQLEVKTSVRAVGRAALCRSLKISKKSRPSPWRGNEIHVCKMTDDHTGKPVWLFVYLALVCFTHLTKWQHLVVCNKYGSRIVGAVAEMWKTGVGVETYNPSAILFYYNVQNRSWSLTVFICGELLLDVKSSFCW